ncbi:phosphomannomutase, partial [Endozoicomonas sp. ONNA1]|uniref:phosphomannomutase n=1 Tax=Endozoicomonas sp. ONNA1 TaxID=2828740 RepID=UPI0021481B5C
SIMITGSHIPFDRNGIKFYRPDGEISKPDEAAILSVDEELPAYQSFLPEESDHARASYIRRYTDMYPSDALHGLRIGLYEHSAAGREISREILQRLGAEVVSLGRTESFVPIDTEAVSEEDRTRGRKWAEDHNLDAIFSTDGDGDRPLLADENGEWLRGDILGLLCAKSLGVEALAVPVSCNTAIELTGAFEEVARTQIGSPFVIEEMETLATRHGRVAGFEANGGFLLQTNLSVGSATIDKLPTRDALLPAVVVLTSAISANKTTSQLVAELPERFTASDRVKSFPTTLSKRLIQAWEQTPDKLRADLAVEKQIAAIDTTDGLRATLDNGHIIHFRPSGNAPELRCYCEAERQELAQRLVADYIAALEGLLASEV